jgi:GxxExxY protein
MTELLHRELTGAIIKAYYEVFNHTSRTYPEAIYERALMRELQQQGYAVTQQDEYRIVYKDRVVGRQRLDLFVVCEIVVENKAINTRLTGLNKAQTRSYLKTVGKQVGLLFNFGNAEPQFERIYWKPLELEPKPPGSEHAREVYTTEEWLYPELAYSIMGGLFEVHSTLGPGYIRRMYPNACWHELQLRGHTVRPLTRMEVKYKDEVIGDIAYDHLVVDGKAMIFPFAVTDIRSVHLDNIKDWMRMNDLRLGIIANFNAVRLQTVIVRA